MNRKIRKALVLTLLITLTGCKSGKNTSSGATNSTDGGSFSSITAPSTTNGNGSSTGTSTTGPDSTSSNGSDSTPAVVDGLPERVTLHYQNQSKAYEDYCFWIWSSSVKLEQETPYDGVDDFGMYVTFDVQPYLTLEQIEFYFLVKSLGSWDFKTKDIQIRFSNFTTVLENDVPTMHVYAIEYTKSQIELGSTPDGSDRDRVKTAEFIDNYSKLKVVASGPLKNLALYAYDAEYYSKYKTAAPSFAARYIVRYYSKIGLAEAELAMPDNFIFEYGRVYEIKTEFESNDSYTSSYYIDTSSVYNTARFIQTQYYDGDDLGLSFAENGDPIFKVYAPTAGLVQVNIYQEGYPSVLSPTPVSEGDKERYDKPKYTINLVREKNGVFTSVNAAGDWANANVRKEVAEGGYYYTLLPYTSRGSSEVVDPYAKTTSVNSLRAYISSLDVEEMTPEAYAALPKVWDKDPVYDISSPLDLVISENHIRDLTVSSTWSSDPELTKIAGTYKAFQTKGTTYTKNGVTVKTGFDHMEEYGVNAIQILPFFDQDNSDIDSKYNWGYNPLNYNVPEGSYSTDPYDPAVRVYELRELIASYANNANKARIIMDVVYNHVSNASGSNFEALVPGYYFRLDKDGEYLDNSGCGNEFRSESEMGRKFIVDSVVHWATNYKIKGFRFDLMGLIDTETMKAVKEALFEVDPDIVVYGEGWDATGAYATDPSFATTSSAYQSLYASSDSPGYVGGFNDAGRNAIRGSNNGGNHYPGYGMISQGTESIAGETAGVVADMVRGVHTGKGANPYQTVNYASCHDNYTLFDQLNWTLSADGGVTEPNIIDVAKASVAVNGTILFSNGISFINGGEEIFRSKEETDPTSSYAVTMYGKKISHNSYTSSDETNSYKYDRKVDLLDYFKMYQTMVGLRKNLIAIDFDKNIVDKNSIDVWDYGQGKTTFSAFRKGADNTSYFIFFGGRNNNPSFNFGAGTELMNNGVNFQRNSSGLVAGGAYAFGVYSYKEA